MYLQFIAFKYSIFNFIVHLVVSAEQKSLFKHLSMWADNSCVANKEI